MPRVMIFRGDKRPRGAVHDEIYDIFEAASRLVVAAILNDVNTRHHAIRPLVGWGNADKGELYLWAPDLIRKLSFRGQCSNSQDNVYRTRFGRTALREIAAHICDAYQPVGVFRADLTLLRQIVESVRHIIKSRLNKKIGKDPDDEDNNFSLTDHLLIAIKMEDVAEQVERRMSAHQRIKIEKVLWQFLVKRRGLSNEAARELITRLSLDEGLHPDYERYAEIILRTASVKILIPPTTSSSPGPTVQPGASIP